jgi:predicted Zn-dependent protease
MVLVWALVFGVASAGAQQTRGEARIGGKVLDDQKKPVQGVVITAKLGDATPPLQAKSNNRGEWSISNMAGGQWQVEFTKEGFAPQRATVDLKPDERITSVEVILAKAAPDPNVEIQAKYKEANDFLQAQKAAEARKIFEDLLAKYPELHQVHRSIAATYMSENQLDKAVEHLRLGLEKDPASDEMKTWLGDVLMEKGEKAEAEKILLSVDMTKVKDPHPFINLAIVKINDQKGEEALALVDKLIAQFPTQSNLYYYRGRANIAMKKLPEAKKDLEKFVAAALPDARELPDAKKVLEQLKDVK